MSNYGVHKLCRAALHDIACRNLMKTDPEAEMARFPLSEREKQMLRDGDVGGLWERGVSGFLLSYLTRWELFGLTVPVYCDRMRAAKDWRYPDGGEPVTSGREGRH